MKSFERYQQMVEKQEHLEFVLQVLSSYFGISCKSDDDLSNAVYKATNCGAWGKVTEQGKIIFGTIVEGSDAEFTCTPIETWERDEGEIELDIEEALRWLEGESSIVWIESNTNMA